MADNTTRVDITADAGQANREFSNWAQNVASASAIARLAISDIGSASHAMQGQLRGDMREVNDSLRKVMDGFKQWAAILGGGKVLKESVDATAGFTKEALGLSKVLGINTKDAATLNVALGDIYSNAETMTDAAGKMAKQLRTNEDDLNRLGIVTRDQATGALLNLRDILLDSLRVLNEYEEGTSRDIAVQIAFGKGAEGVAGLLKLNNQILEEARQKQEELGLTVTTVNVEAAKRFKAAMNDVGDVLLAVKKGIGDAVMPALTDLANWFIGAGPQGVAVIKGAIGGLVSVFWGLRNAAVIAWQVVDSAVFTMAEPVMAVSRAFAKLVSGDFKGAAAELAAYPDHIRDRWSYAWKEIVASSEETSKQLWDLFAQSPEEAAPKKAGKTIDPNDFKEKKEAPSRMGEWESALAERKAAITRAGLEESVLREMSKADELKYWQDIRAQAGLTQTEKVALTRKSADVEMAMVRERFDVTVKTLEAEAAQYKHNTAERLRIEEQIQRHYAKGTKEYEAAQQRINEIRRQADEQARQVAASRAQADRDARLQTIALEEQTAQQAQQLGLLTMQQLLQMQQQFEQQRFQIAMQALQERLALAQADPDRSVVELENIHRQIEQLEQQHQLKLAQIRGQAQQDATRYERGVIEGIGAQTQSIISRLGTQIRGLRDLFRASLEGLVQIGLNIIGQMAAEWIKTQLSAMVLDKVTSIGTITRKSAEAGAGGVASMAAAPYPINLTAPAFGAAMAAAALAFAPAASAALGFDIPAGVQPIVQTHAREMILPARLADTVRDMARVYAGTQAVGAPQLAAGPSVVMHVSIANANFADRRNRDQVLSDFYSAAARAARRNN